MSDVTCQEMFDDVEFHDGVINSVSLSIVERTCEIDLSLGDYKVGRARSVCLLSCAGTEEFFGRFGFEELARNASFGNIQDGRVDASRGSLRLYLAGGLVEAAGRDVRLAALPRPMDATETSRVRAGGGGFKQIEGMEFDFSYLESIHFSPAAGICSMNLLIRNGGITSEPQPVTIAFGGVTSCLARLDVASLAAEHRFGNVRSCIVHRKQNMIRMYVSDGFIEVVAMRVSIVQP
ncbi:hypothetical protein [uncultured Stenotrophomonas sp.]|uniref:hypothetical protein n=1 Tax=uncultured Stenotrophomonas sp. TaxID=165438 RepID=UPI0028D5D1A9|nr:hypothetical protein [uncultured Stenotrophomonas sp.]